MRSVRPRDGLWLLCHGKPKPGAETDIAGYKAYCCTAPRIYGAAVILGKMMTTTVGNLPGGKTYYCAVTAFDTAGNESRFSGEVSKRIP